MNKFLTAYRVAAFSVSVFSAAVNFCDAEPAEAQDTIFPTPNVPWTTCTSSSITNAVICLQEDANVEIFIQNTIEWTVGAANIWNQLLNQYDPTDLTILWDLSPTYTGADETDIVYQSRADVPGGLAGIAWCDDAVSGTRCDQHYVAFRTNQPGWDLACHESGHAMGLLHGPESWPALNSNAAVLGCMRNPLVANLWTIGTLNTSNINGAY